MPSNHGLQGSSQQQPWARYRQRNACAWPSTAVPLISRICVLEARPMRYGAVERHRSPCEQTHHYIEPVTSTAARLLSIVVGACAAEQALRDKARSCEACRVPVVPAPPLMQLDRKCTRVSSQESGYAAAATAAITAIATAAAAPIMWLLAESSGRPNVDPGAGPAASPSASLGGRARPGGSEGADGGSATPSGDRATPSGVRATPGRPCAGSAAALEGSTGDAAGDTAGGSSPKPGNCASWRPPAPTPLGALLVTFSLRAERGFGAAELAN